MGCAVEWCWDNSWHPGNKWGDKTEPQRNSRMPWSPHQSIRTSSFRSSPIALVQCSLLVNVPSFLSETAFSSPHLSFCLSVCLFIYLPSTSVSNHECLQLPLGFCHSSVGKESTCSAGIHLQRKRPRFDSWVWKILWRRHGNQLHYSCLESPMHRGALRATVNRVIRVGHDLVTKPPPPPVTFCVVAFQIQIPLRG